MYRRLSKAERKLENTNRLRTNNSTLRIKYEGVKKLLEKKDKEIERLNNIINELKWKPIEEYDKGNYDWVLVKYFDEDYECVPCVAEKRFGKWHSIDEKEIKFEVKYFFDMQQLDKLQVIKSE